MEKYSCCCNKSSNMTIVKIRRTEILSQTKYALKKIRFDRQKDDGSWESQEKEVYERGHAAAALLYNKEQRTVILTKQFRLPVFLDGNSSGTLLEACAGLVDEGEQPDDTIRREIKEETGYAVDAVQKIYEAYASPGVSTELLHLYVAEYKKEQKVSEGGGVKEEKEDIQVMELGFDDALQMMENAEIKDVKAIILLQYANLKQLL
jgi:GDP-mannose pyrophosphatase NudK